MEGLAGGGSGNGRGCHLFGGKVWDDAEIWEAGETADDLRGVVFFGARGVVGVVEHDTQGFEIAVTQFRDGEQGVVHGSQAGGSHYDDCWTEVFEEVCEGPVGTVGDQQAAGALDDHEIELRGEVVMVVEDRVHLDGLVLAGGSDQGAGRQREAMRDDVGDFELVQAGHCAEEQAVGW